MPEVMQLFAIQHINGNYLTDKTRGSSWWEGEAEKGLPRLFKTEGQARGWRTCWLKGRVIKHYDYEGEYSSLDYAPRPLRQLSQLQIIPITLIPGEPCA